MMGSPIRSDFMDKRMSKIVPGDRLGDEFKGYLFRISGGNDKQGFPMKQGVLTQNRVRLLLSQGDSCYRPRRDGERKRKSVRGCVTSPDLSVMSLVIVKQGPQDIPGLTDNSIPNRLGPKRANHIRKFFVRSQHPNFFWNSTFCLNPFFYYYYSPRTLTRQMTYGNM